MSLICDFCSTPNPTWAYPATDAPLPEPLGVSIGAWCACDACSALIEAHAPAALAARSAAIHAQRLGHPINAEVMEELHRHCFWTHLIGPRRPATMEVN